LREIFSLNAQLRAIAADRNKNITEDFAADGKRKEAVHQ